MTASHASHFALIHEIFVLDSFLRKALDQKNMRKATHDFVEELLTALRMEKLAPLGIYPATDLRAPGWSFVQPITTSHIGGHYFEKPGRPCIHLDVYSCASVNWRKVVSTVHKHFLLEEWRANFVDRQIVHGNERLTLEIHGVEDQVLGECKMFVSEVSEEKEKRRAVLV